MRILIVVAHGSRRAGSNEEVTALAEQLRLRLGGRYAQVMTAFLELAEPSIPVAIDEAVAAGADEVVLLPYFLAAGYHVVEDIPALVAQRREAHPNVEITLLPHLGASGQLPGLLADLV
jgi:sirohydrochlorin ferrochelatase